MNDPYSTPPEDAQADLDLALARAYARAQAPVEVSSVLERLGAGLNRPLALSLRGGRADAPPEPEGGRSVVGCRAGKYSLEELIGRGGMGEVHRGRDEDLGREVAIKFLSEAYRDDPALLERFVEEAQIGGQLQHPGIVPVYDLGLADGRPFFSMKLVGGTTLAERLATRTAAPRDLPALLAVFESACQAIAYAHSRGVIHRDLKPGNIMIGSFGEVQVVDWGLGKVLDREEGITEPEGERRRAVETVRAGDQGARSLVGTVMGTPAYMSPEQARGEVERMDEASDVFALGAILCEILTGIPPYDGRGDEVLAHARAADLAGAHARLTASSSDPELVSLARLCLQVEPEDRSSSAQGVVEIVQGYRAGQEQRAQAARLEAAEERGRAVALLQSRKVSRMLTAGIAAGLLLALWFWRDARSAARAEGTAKAAAVLSARTAEAELVRAREIKSLITEMLTGITTEEALGADTTLLESILDRTSRRLLAGQILDARVAGELHHVVGDVYHKVGRYRDAEPHLVQAVELLAIELGLDSEECLQSRDALADLLISLGRYSQAEELLREIIVDRGRVQGPDGFDTLASSLQLATVLHVTGRQPEAFALVETSVRTQERVLGAEHPSTLEGKRRIAAYQIQASEWAKAEQLLSEVRVLQEGSLGSSHPSTLKTMRELAFVRGLLGRHAEAEALFLETIETGRRVLGAGHLVTLSPAPHLISMHLRQGELDKAEERGVPLLADCRDYLGSRHPHTLNVVGEMARVSAALGDTQKAEALFREAVSGYVERFGWNFQRTFTTVNQAASFLQSLGRDEEASELIRQVLDAVEDDPRTAWNLNSAVWSMRDCLLPGTPEAERSIALARRACQLEEAAAGPLLWGYLDTLAEACFRMGQIEDAVAAQRRSVELATDPVHRARNRQLLLEYEAALEKR